MIRFRWLDESTWSDVYIADEPSDEEALAAAHRRFSRPEWEGKEPDFELKVVHITDAEELAFLEERKACDLRKTMG
jgi:hypothetical protein